MGSERLLSEETDGVMQPIIIHSSNESQINGATLYANESPLAQLSDGHYSLTIGRLDRLYLDVPCLTEGFNDVPDTLGAKVLHSSDGTLYCSNKDGNGEVVVEVHLSD